MQEIYSEISTARMYQVVLMQKRFFGPSKIEWFIEQVVKTRVIIRHQKILYLLSALFNKIIFTQNSTSKNDS